MSFSLPESHCPAFMTEIQCKLHQVSHFWLFLYLYIMSAKIYLLHNSFWIWPFQF